MSIAIVYDSSAATTAKAAETMEAYGQQCHVQSIVLADAADVSEADLICVGS